MTYAYAPMTSTRQLHRYSYNQIFQNTRTSFPQQTHNSEIQPWNVQRAQLEQHNALQCAQTNTHNKCTRSQKQSMIFNVKLSVNITPYSPYTINVKDITQKRKKQTKKMNT